MYKKKVVVLHVQQDGENYLLHLRLESQRSIVLEIGPEQGRMLCLALTPTLQSATLESIGAEIASMLSFDEPVEVPFSG